MHEVHKLVNEKVLSHALEPKLPLYFFSVTHDKTSVVVEKELPFLSDVGQNVASKCSLPHFATVWLLPLFYVYL